MVRQHATRTLEGATLHFGPIRDRECRPYRIFAEHKALRTLAAVVHGWSTQLSPRRVGSIITLCLRFSGNRVRLHEKPNPENALADSTGGTPPQDAFDRSGAPLCC